MASRKDREERRERRRAGSTARDAKHRAGGDWTTIDIPDGIEVFQPKEGTYRMDIVPYTVGKGNPYAEPGMEYYERTFFVHRGIGPNNQSFICPAKTADMPCPICEFRSKLAKDPDGDENLIASLKPKERQLFLVHVHSREDDGKEIKLYESSFHTFGNLLDKRRQDAEADEPHISDFDDAEAGATLKVSYQEKEAGSYSFIECYSIDFKPRPNGLDSDLIDHGICLDDLLKIESYDRLKQIFLQEEDPNEDNDDDADEDDIPDKKPAKKATKSTTKGTDSKLTTGMTVRHRTLGVCEIMRISGDGTSLVLQDEDGEIHRPIDVDEVRVEQAKASKSAKKSTTMDDDDDDDPPAKKPAKGTSAKKKVEPEPDDDELWDDDDDQDDEPPAKSSAKKTTKKATTSAAKKNPVADDDDDLEWDD